MRINFDVEESEYNFYRRLSDITGMPLAELIRRAIRFYAHAPLSESFGEIRTLLKHEGKEGKDGCHEGRKKGL